MKWVSMSEREPKPGYWYLTVLKTCNVYNISYWSGNHWRNSYGDKHETHEVAYWCPLPPKPNKVEMAIGKIQETIDTYNAQPWAHHCTKSQTMKNLEDAVCLLKEHLHEMS